MAQIREAEAEQGLPELDGGPRMEPKGPILDKLTSDEAQLELWIAVGRGLIASSQAQACQQLLEDGLTAFGRYGIGKQTFPTREPVTCTSPRFRCQRQCMSTTAAHEDFPYTLMPGSQLLKVKT